MQMSNIRDKVPYLAHKAQYREQAFIKFDKTLNLEVCKERKIKESK